MTLERLFDRTVGNHSVQVGLTEHFVTFVTERLKFGAGRIR
jgi:hypothetical protein